MYEITKITWKVSSTERKKWIPAPLCALFCIMVGRKVNFYALQNYVFVFLVWCSKFWKYAVVSCSSSKSTCINLEFFLVFIVWSFCRSCSILENSSVYWKSWSGCNGLSIISTNKLGHLLLRHLQADVILFAINFPSKKWAALEQKNAFRLPQQL